MTLPKRPERSSPIPNEPFESPEVTTIRGPYWEMAIGSGLEADPYGSVQVSGSESLAPTAYLYGSSGFVGLGDGLQINPDGELEQSSNYIYCVPQFDNLPVTYPPYGCLTEVNTSEVVDFTEAWRSCNFTEFPCVDTSSGTNFTLTWRECSSLTSFPALDLSSGTNFSGTWFECHSLTSFPLIDLNSGTTFSYAWGACFSLTTFPAGMFNKCLATDFLGTWQYCALTQQSVDNILVSLDTAGQSNGAVNIDGGTSSAPSAVGLAAKASLEARGWTVVTN